MIEEILKKAVEQQATDVFLVAGSAISIKVGGHFVHDGEEHLMPDRSAALITELYEAAGRDMSALMLRGDDDFSFAIKGVARFRVNTYKQRGSLAAVIRVIAFGIPDYKAMGIPETVMDIAKRTNGLVLVTGPAGGGKSTTLACMIDRINNTREGHIITLEEPIEYLHRNKLCIVSQREIEMDSENFISALRACLRQSPDVILLGEMRDEETIRTAMTAAETGHLVLSTLHTLGAANAIDRIIDAFPVGQQTQMRAQLSMLLAAVVSQQLVNTADGGVVPVFEVMKVNNAIKNMIRESKNHQIDSVIKTSGSEGMISMDAGILELFKEGRITRDTAIAHAIATEQMIKRTSAGNI